MAARSSAITTRPNWCGVRNGSPIRTAPDLLAPIPGGASFRAGTATVLILEPAAVAKRYAGTALTSEDGSDRMVALTFKVASLATPRTLFDASGVAYRAFADGIVVAHADAANVALAFTA